MIINKNLVSAVETFSHDDLVSIRQEDKTIIEDQLSFDNFINEIEYLFPLFKENKKACYMKFIYHSYLPNSIEVVVFFTNKRCEVARLNENLDNKIYYFSYIEYKESNLNLKSYLKKAMKLNEEKADR